MTRLPDVRHIDGAVLLGASSLQRDDTFTAVSPATGEPIGPTFSQATPDDVDQACALASAASHSFAEMAPSARADFLDAIGDAIAAIGEPLIQTAVLETALPRMRIEGERARTINQLRLFADVLRRGEWIDATIDLALPERTPSARPDLRRLNVAVGPVAVFGASNFPLAFSVAGGDTASALAAGCPVVVKGHPAHPGTGEHVGRAIRRAAIDCGIHPGVFSLLPGTRHEIGGALVADARIKAVGFTGSRAGGRALVAIAAQREEPIPVYAEMSSVNPVILLPAALRARGHDIAKAFAASMTMGAGQFCTNPGLIIAIDGPELDGFVDVARDAVADSLAAPMLSGSIHAAYERGVEALEDHPAISTIARGRMTGSGVAGCAALFVTNAASFMSDPALAFEVFGA
ncbi:MAG: NADP-dependent fatty aldehyde dehydrogenase, partial [Bradyrhizobium sp.]|nr:NADP-dependent fatty aldehyde dehydrogenase [Bradyrhizobium sp.]